MAFLLYTRTNAPQRARGYSDNDKLLAAVEWVAVPASGSYQSTVRDLAALDRALNSDTILTENTRGLMWSPVILNDGTTAQTGLGWGLGPFAGLAPRQPQRWPPGLRLAVLAISGRTPHDHPVDQSRRR